ncbi:DNA double-strand break repair Rad50 ATPase protein [Marine Group I thaumarchaeote SCGC RSA3]|uniref:DNA double-strand break repair Rad50 ATPase protein n=2 Tax=Marine Group I TaxID=905826 RepID=A0A081RP00_9ARCH|nr:DNA double-strand break repair Rad50 ATPase protein [Marine Group I thaumarchaeote SCGC AAA799-N04]KFM17411.1 DNA double-strand break repair Rad50 ATPase protein [Marine Group I thaumarchaeote SCGC RSA3]
MILNSIIIDNIRSYDHEEVIFPRGISLFEGDIGSGKSTILMAIEFALFGLGSQKPEALLAKKSESGFVILDFSVDGEKYEIKRTLKRKNSGVNQDPKNSWIKIDGEILPLSPSELKQQVLQILKFNEPADPKAESKIFRYAIFTPQEAMKEVLSDSRKRLETIRKAFGIEDYSIAESNAREVLTKIKAKIGVFQERFSNISELESEIIEARKIISETEKVISQTRGQTITLQKDEEAKENEIKKLLEKNNEKIKLEGKKENITDKIDSANQQIENIEKNFVEFESEFKENNEKFEKLMEIKKPQTTKSISDIASEIKKLQEINDERIKLETEKNTISDDLTKLKETLGEKINSEKSILEKALEDLQNEKKDLEKFSDEIKQQQDKIKEEQIQKTTQKKSLEQEIAEFSTLGNACPTCKQEITEKHHHTLVDEKQEQVDSLDKELKSITVSFFESSSKLKEVQLKIDSYDEEISKIEKILPGIEEYAVKSLKLSQIEARFDEISSQFPKEYGRNPIDFLNELKNSITQYENAQEQMEQIAQRKQVIVEKIESDKASADTLLVHIKEKESELREIEKQLGQFGRLDEKVASLEKELNGIRDEITRFSGIVAASNEKLNNEQNKITQNEQKISESKKWESKYKKFVQFQEWLESFFIPTISQIEKQVLLSILQNFNETYTRWYSILVEDPTKESRIDENFTPIVNQDGYEQEIVFLSGGEKTSIALAYRLTLNSLMRKETESMKSNLLILDEPTDGFSKNQLGKIRELLDELKSEQIILVSHEKELETYVDNIFQISKEDGLSKISRLN